MPLPNDILEKLKSQGIQVDENGDIIDPNDELLNQVEEQNENEEDDDSETEVEEDESEDELSDELEDENDDTGSEEDDDEQEVEDVQEEVKKPKLTKKKKLTRTEKEEQQESELEAFKREVTQRLDSLQPKTPSTPDLDNSEATIEQRLLNEVKQFKKLRVEEFSRSVRNQVNSMELGASFDEIITSDQWGEYLKGSVLGANVSDLYMSAIQNADNNSVISFFKDFSSKYLGDEDEVKKSKTTNKSLDDLTVPEKNKAQKVSKSKTKYDFEEDDYSKMLEQLSRKRITKAEFNKFDAKFNEAWKKNRVKTN